jgi:S1/P1 Nuclease
MSNRFPAMKCWILLTVVLSSFASEAWAWGEEGHSIIAEIAQRRLSQDAAKAVTQILGTNPKATSYSTPSLASVSTWADEVRYNGPQPNETYNWHFVDIPRQDTHYDPATECPKEKPEQGDCVINELSRLRNELRCATGDQQLRALKFAVHFVGDIHQPFHTIWENAGGNGITFKPDKIQFKGKTCTAENCSTPPDNLHKMWDTTLIRAMEYNWPTFVDDLESDWLTTDAAKNDGKDDPVTWAEDAHNAANTFNVWVDAGATLDQPYYDRVTPLISQQLGFAGLRLARYLNDVFSSSQCPYTPHQ